MCCDRTNKDNPEEEKFGSENAGKARDLEKQVNPYDWVGTVKNNSYLHEYGPELTGSKVSVDHSSFTTTVSIHGGRKAKKSTSPLRFWTADLQACLTRKQQLMKCCKKALLRQI